jgi:hypothetical protein
MGDIGKPLVPYENEGCISLPPPKLCQEPTDWLSAGDPVLMEGWQVVQPLMNLFLVFIRLGYYHQVCQIS